MKWNQHLLKFSRGLDPLGSRLQLITGRLGWCDWPRGLRHLLGLSTWKSKEIEDFSQIQAISPPPLSFLDDFGARRAFSWPDVLRRFFSEALS